MHALPQTDVGGQAEDHQPEGQVKPRQQEDLFRRAGLAEQPTSAVEARRQQQDWDDDPRLQQQARDKKRDAERADEEGWEEFENEDAASNHRALENQKCRKVAAVEGESPRDLRDGGRHNLRANKSEYLVPLLGHALCGKGL